MRRSRKRRTTSVEERPASPRAEHVGRADDDDRQPARARSAAPRPRPRAWRRRTGCRAPPRHSVALVGRRRPAAPGRSRRPRRCARRARRSARRHSSSTVARRPRRWPANSAVGRAPRRFVEPATWKTRSTSLQRPPHRAPVGDVGDRRARRRAPPAASRFEVARTVTRTSSPRATSARATCEPTNPVAPVTSGGRPSASPRLRADYAHAPMARVAVVTDTTHYLPRELVAAARDLHLVSLYVNWEGETDREADLPDFDASTTLMRSAASCRARRSRRSATSSRSTSRCSRPGATSSRSTCRGGISGTVRAAEQARDQLVERGIAAERIVVLDSATAVRGARAAWRSRRPTRSRGRRPTLAERGRGRARACGAT